MPPQDLAPFQPMSQAPAPLKIGKFQASRRIVSEAWALLKQDKEIMWLPVLSSITSLITLIVMGVLFFILAMDGDIEAFKGQEEVSFGGLEYLFALVYYTIMFFIINFFQAGIFIIAHGRMNGRDLSLRDGLQGASDVAGKIFVWSLISATVGVVLRAISERSKLIGTIVAGMLGAAWNILTYFSLPSLVIGNVSVTDSFKMSADTIRKTWGETIIVQVGAGLFFMIIFFAVFVLGIGTMILVPTMLVFISVACLLVLFTLTFSVITSALSSIFKLALFEYARTGKVPQGFSPELIQGAITAK